MATNQFYVDMSDYQLKAVLKEITENLKVEPDSPGMQQELELCLNVIKERDITPSSSVIESLQALRGYVEFGVNKSGHGGKREGAGRPAVGETRKVSISLPKEYWQQFEQKKGDRSQSQFLREIIMKEVDG